jgi:large subunit ribosomal protein L3
VSLNLLGNKIGMTQIFDKKGDVIPVTIIQGGPCFITQLKNIENCGYNAIQLGYTTLSSNSKHLTKPLLGHFTKKNLLPFRYLKEFKVKTIEKYQLGQKFTVEQLKIGEKLNISGLTIGKGNAGNIKQHNFKRGPMGHGSKHKRLQGSLGSGTTPGRVFPGKRMPGRYGGDKRTVEGLEIIDIDITNNLLAIKGCIPGKFGNLLKIRLKEEQIA